MFQNIDDKKAILDSKRPLSKEAIDNLKRYFDVELTYNSNAIEGNTLTITETKVIRRWYNYRKRKIIKRTLRSY